FGYRFFVSPVTLPLLRQRELMDKKIDFPRSANPDVTVIIPVFNQLPYTFNCLKSLKENLPKTVTLEILVVDDCSTDDTPAFLLRMSPGLHTPGTQRTKGSW